LMRSTARVADRIFWNWSLLISDWNSF
jgi:hypothetical protein